jgi:hypothetical protein
MVQRVVSFSCRGRRATLRIFRGTNDGTRSASLNTSCGVILDPICAVQEGYGRDVSSTSHAGFP